MRGKLGLEVRNQDLSDDHEPAMLNEYDDAMLSESLESEIFRRVGSVNHGVLPAGRVSVTTSASVSMLEVQQKCDMRSGSAMYTSG